MKYKLRELDELEVKLLYPRRIYLKELIENGVDVDRRVSKEIRAKFEMSRSELLEDIRYLTVTKLGQGSYFVTAKMRRFILERDGFICQYCGIQDEYAIVEHVIPTMLGGIAKTYNLVAACGFCNIKKMRTVWIPNNLDSITQDNQAWRDMIISMASQRQEK